MEAAIQAKVEAEAAEQQEREKAKKAEDEAQKAYSKAAAAEAAAKQAVQEAEDANTREKQVVTQNVFLRSVMSHDLDHLLKLHHSIGQDALTIEQFVHNLLDTVNGGKELKPELLRVPLERISLRAARILSICRFATRANHVAASEEHTGDLLEYIREYLENVHGGFVTAQSLDNKQIPIVFQNTGGVSFETTFAPLDVSVVLDNLLSNSRKHGASKITVSVQDVEPTAIRILFRDDGTGVPKKNELQLFKSGFSTTDGSGLGLCHMKEIMNELGGDITFQRPNGPGAEFFLTFPHNEN